MFSLSFCKFSRLNWFLFIFFTYPQLVHRWIYLNEYFVSDASPSKSSGATNKQTVGKKFTIQLENLMQTLNRTEPHYIRCIKPNPQKKPNIFDSKLTNEQLTYSGVFEAVSEGVAGACGSENKI